jgi:hypothetical protein
MVLFMVIIIIKKDVIIIFEFMDDFAIIFYDALNVLIHLLGYFFRVIVVLARILDFFFRILGVAFFHLLIRKFIIICYYLLILTSTLRYFRFMLILNLSFIPLLIITIHLILIKFPSHLNHHLHN